MAVFEEYQGDGCGVCGWVKPAAGVPLLIGSAADFLSVACAFCKDIFCKKTGFIAFPYSKFAINILVR